MKSSNITTGSCGRRGQRAVFPETFVAGVAHPDRWAKDDEELMSVIVVDYLSLPGNGGLLLLNQCIL
jgi:hypothetical protein